MADLIENEQLDIDCDALLVKSIRIYQEIDKHYTLIQNELSNTSVYKACAAMDSLGPLLAESRNIDSLIAEGLRNQAILPASTTDLLAEREAMLANLYHANRRIESRAQNFKSLLQHDIRTLSTTQNAMKGYKPADTGRKNIFRNCY